MVKNFVLQDSARFVEIQTTRFIVCDYYIYIPSYSGEGIYESYKKDTDELTLVYIKDVSSDEYFVVYDKKNIIADPVATFKISYVQD